ncbi:MAG: hypothetical protein COB16_17450 [Rhodobacteraceae bacterium]|nr:MAG: hypothetical protein COB16_17450 [Paracoccaceae bacterium]
MEISPAREALLANDPYLIGAAHRRHHFNLKELVANLESIMACPIDAIAQWSGDKFALVTSCNQHQADRTLYAELTPCDPKTTAAVLAAFDEVSKIPPFAAIVAGGTHRLAISTACSGSSSISSLPGYSMIEAPQVGQPWGPRQFNGLVHEAVHGLLFLAECFADRQLVREGSRSTISSPWTGSPLDTYQFAQALVVWHVLLAYWSQVDVQSPERATAAKGFDGAQGAIRTLDAIRKEIEPDYLDILYACATRAGQSI